MKRISRKRLEACRAAAHAALDQVGLPRKPSDPIIVALSLGLRVEPWDVQSGMLVGQAVLVWPGFSSKQFAAYVAHEVGHHILRERILDRRHTEEEADAVDATLLGWSPEELRACVDEGEEEHAELSCDA